MQAQQHNTAFKYTLEGVSGLVSKEFTENEQHATGIQIDIEGTTTAPATVDYTPIGSDSSDRKSPVDNTVDHINGLTIFPIKFSKIWVDLTPAGAGPFNVHLVGYKL